ncbi:MAG: hypothetical protein WA210_22280, partial [Burkholderiaceae bacterium]
QQACTAIGAAGPGLEALLEALQGAALAETARACPPGAAVTAPIDRQELLAALRQMAEQLHNGDMAATDACLDIQRRFGAAVAGPLLPIEEAISALDFERAARLCHEWIAELVETQPA